MSKDLYFFSNQAFISIVMPLDNKTLDSAKIFAALIVAASLYLRTYEIIVTVR